MPRFVVQWNYSNMKSLSPALNGSDGVFGFTTESEWKAVPNMSLLSRIGVAASISRRGRISPDRRMSMVGSPHQYFYDVRSTGIMSCHVAVADHGLVNVPVDQSLPYYMQFDLPGTAEDDFTGVLEKLGAEKAKHPYYDTDKGVFSEDVSLQGTTTRIAFRGLAQ
jgi:hypothetical protein